MHNKLKLPLFLFGCPRSGTTYLQSLLTAHPEIISLPETKFFHYLLPDNEPKRRILGMASRRLRPKLETLFKNEINRPDLLKYLPKNTLFIRQYTRRFLKIMNLLAEEEGKSIWLEKTPEHIRHIDYIEKNVPIAKFIHIQRNGIDVVASLYEVSNKYPKFWYGGFDIDHCIDRWIEAVNITSQHLHKDNHILVKYEKLVDDTPTILKELCKFIGIEFDNKMLEDYQETAKSLVRKQSGRVVSQGAVNTRLQKFYQVFDQSQQEYILSRFTEVGQEQN
ncbi:MULTISPECIES: sulfotransferase [Okeania]|uniref:sulfotransferase family protein n=1 Tax=Okeania TaxID=1458928 RepID=UPI000F537A69|nr:MULTISPECIES: sulfotransferase [Okeania]NET13480.1 sulfotransferase [Okeania sp. SIO1H6]NES78856.1 sulfotransferase [Okeania sp. SIO1H4]NES92375.1 sulfotransferase [Okeania sp. SIO2B9]NET22830.1 sulfotransferase [Okeania sp. SIO1H5]NET77205.1 sulfotransferase [Okeania sp. SIO1F9]